MTTVLYDNESPNVLYSGQPKLDVDTKYLSGSSNELSIQSVADSFSIKFSGTSIMLYGALGSKNGITPEPLQAIIDGKHQPNVQLEPNNDEPLRILHVFEALPEAAWHNLTITGTSPPGSGGSSTIIFDYAAVVAGLNTPLAGESLIVDDLDDSVVYDGNWEPSPNFLLFDDSGPRFAYANTSHQTFTEGASATFTFNGTSASAFGASSNSQLKLDIEIDGKEFPRSIIVNHNSTNARWYECSGLSPSNHTLKITYAGGDSNATFNLDYFTYTPSFASLAEKEGLNVQPAQSSRGVLLGAIIGPVLFVIIVAILLFLRKKKLAFWSSGSSNTGSSRLPSYDEHDAAPTTSSSNGFMHTFVARLLRRPQPGLVEAFPPDYSPSSSRQSWVQQKPVLPVWSPVDRQTTYQTDIGETTADLRIRELEQVILSLRQEIGETRRQDRPGALNEAPMRQTVENHRPNERNHGSRDYDSMISVTVV